MTLREFLSNIASSLGDYDKNDASLSFQQWSLEFLIAAYNEGINAISSFKPQDFVQTNIMKLQPGTTQISCCKILGSVFEYTDAVGTHISYLKPLDAKTAVRPWRGKSFTKQTFYKPTHTFKVDSASDSFEILPSVPNTGDYYVKVRCIKNPVAKDLADLDVVIEETQYMAALSSYVMFKAFSGETEVSSLNNAQLHYRVFNELLGIQLKSSEKFAASQNTWTSGANYATGVSPV